MKLKYPILTRTLAGAGLLAGVIYANAQQPPTAAPPPVDPATHAAHVASGAMPPDAAKADPALAKQIADLQAKTAQLQATLASGASAGTPLPAPVPPAPAAMPMPPAAPPATGMGKMKPSAAMPGMAPPAPAAPAMAGMGMMPMMEKMMGMMDKMMGMGAAAMPAAPMAGMPAAPAMPPGGMGMPMMEKMMPMMDKMMGMGAAAMPPAPMAGMPAAAPAMPPAMGMDKMKMASMMGMGPMGTPAPGAMPPSALPGFPGASHLYHIGATGFFLDHPEHIALTTEQQAALTTAKEQSDLAKSTADRATEQAEQDLWSLTATDQPDAAKIEAKLAEICKLTGDKRLAFIRAVGEASKLLTDEQRKSLTGFAPPVPSAPMAAPAPMAPMADM